MVAAPPDKVLSMRQQYGLDRPYLLTVGTLEPRKNIGFLIDVFEQLADTDIDLVIAGMRGWKYEPVLEQMRACSQANRIHYLEYVEENNLPALYTAAELFVFPSLYEGFGFTPLEAMACGTPVVSSSAGSLAEVLGSGAMQLEEYHADNWAHAIRDLLGNNGKRTALSQAGQKQTAKYNWADTAKKTWGIYEQLV